jgi:hypothetical protein
MELHVRLMRMHKLFHVQIAKIVSGVISLNGESGLKVDYFLAK